jgi:hypothetical protein
MRILTVSCFITFLAFSLSAKANDGMWYIGVDMCGAGPLASKCVDGVMADANSDKFVSREICEVNAQRFAVQMRQIAFDVKRVWCEQRRANEVPH